MWYLTWILGLTASLAAVIINVMWYESEKPTVKAKKSNKK